MSKRKVFDQVFGWDFISHYMYEFQFLLERIGGSFFVVMISLCVRFERRIFKDVLRVLIAFKKELSCYA